jgi:hypothetical protein
MGLNFGVNGLFPVWGQGVNLTGSAGLSFMFGTWFYEGRHHRVTAVQLDTDVAYRVFESPHGVWMAAIGTVYQGWNCVFPAIKAQVFATRPFEHASKVVDSFGIALSVSFDVVFHLPTVSGQPTLNPQKPVFLFDDGSKGGGKP